MTSVLWYGISTEVSVLHTGYGTLNCGQKKAWSSSEVQEQTQVCGSKCLNKSYRLTGLSHEQEDRGASLWKKFPSATDHNREVTMHFALMNCVLCHRKGPLIVVREYGIGPDPLSSPPAQWKLPSAAKASTSQTQWVFKAISNSF